MRDQEITELFWERKEQAVTESNIRYGAYCRRISHNILANKEDVEECNNLLTLMCSSYANLVAFKVRAVKCMHWLSNLF